MIQIIRYLHIIAGVFWGEGGFGCLTPQELFLCVFNIKNQVFGDLLDFMELKAAILLKPPLVHVFNTG